jgi:NitT/TauT family transport system substrate-binding protein
LATRKLAHLRGVALALVALALAVGCAPAPPAAPAAKPPASAPAAAPPAAAAAPAPVAAAAQPPAAPQKIRVGVSGIGGEIGMYVADARGYFAEEGLEVEFVRLRGASEQLAPLATGELHFGGGAPDPAIFNAARREIGVKIVSSLSIIPPGGGGGAALLVRQDHIDSGRFRDLGDLRGMSIGLSALGASAQLFVERMVERGGLTINDVQLTILQVPDTLSGLTNKGVDAAFAIEPFVALSEGQGVAKNVITVGDVFPGASSTLLTLGPVFEREQPDAVRRFAVAFLRGHRVYWQATRGSADDRDALIPVFTTYTNVKDAALYARMMWPSVDPNGALDLTTLDVQQDYFLKTGVQQEKQDINRVVDPSYLNYAADRLGRVAP